MVLVVGTWCRKGTYFMETWLCPMSAIHMLCSCSVTVVSFLLSLITTANNKKRKASRACRTSWSNILLPNKTRDILDRLFQRFKHNVGSCDYFHHLSDKRGMPWVSTDMAVHYPDIYQETWQNHGTKELGILYFYFISHSGKIMGWYNKIYSHR